MRISRPSSGVEIRLIQVSFSRSIVMPVAAEAASRRAMST